MSLVSLALPLILLAAAVYAGRRARAQWFGDKIQAGILAILAGLLVLGAAFTAILDVVSLLAR